jgi:hypothetical protein
LAEVFLLVAGPALVLPDGPAKDFDPGLELGRDMGIDVDSNSDFSDFFANAPSSGLLFGLAVDFNPGRRFDFEDFREDDSDPDLTQDLLSGLPLGLAADFDPCVEFGRAEVREADSDAGLTGDFADDFRGARPLGRSEGFEYLGLFGSRRGRAVVAVAVFVADDTGDFDALFRSRGFFVISILTSNGESIRHFPAGSLSSRRNPI